MNLWWYVLIVPAGVFLLVVVVYLLSVLVSHGWHRGKYQSYNEWTKDTEEPDG